MTGGMLNVECSMSNVECKAVAGLNSTLNIQHSTLNTSNLQGGPLSDTRRIASIVLVWLAVVTALHLTLNVDWNVLLNDRLPEAQRKLNVAYIPVT